MASCDEGVFLVGVDRVLLSSQYTGETNIWECVRCPIFIVFLLFLQGACLLGFGLWAAVAHHPVLTVTQENSCGWFGTDSVARFNV